MERWPRRLGVLLLIGCAARTIGRGSTGDGGAASNGTTWPSLDAGGVDDADAPGDAIEAPVDAAVEAIVPPLTTCGRWIVDQRGRRVKLAGVNWYGASDVRFVPGGLDKVPLARIVATIRALGFNAVRLPFSNEMLHVQKPVDAAAVAANPALAGKTPIEVLDAAVAALTDAGLLVILNNHSTHAMWCCNYDDDGLWYTGDHSEEQWIADWELVAARYARNPRVVGADLRNELRIAKPISGLLPRVPGWGGGGTDDWAAAATRAGNRVLAQNPALLIVVEGINSADDLTGAAAHPIVLAQPHRLVYEAHQYSFFRPGLPAIPGLPGTYGGMSASTLASASHQQWGFVLDPDRPYTAPLWLGEFGVAASDDRTWLTNLAAYLRTTDADFAYWALNGGPKPAGGAEPFGLLEDDWTTVRADWRIDLLRALAAATRGPGVGGESCP